MLIELSRKELIHVIRHHRYDFGDMAVIMREKYLDELDRWDDERIKQFFDNWVKGE